MRDIILNGAEGRLEAKYYQGDSKNAPTALVLHPHPLHGGTMNNKVVYNTFHSFVEMGFSVLRFNFRGVGKSDGEFDKGIGELSDAAIALDWIQSENPNSNLCWVAGFSFGAYIMFQLLMRRPEISGFVGISPPANKYDFGFVAPCVTPGIIIQGTSDEIVSEDSVFKFYEKLAKQRGSKVEYYPIAGADHFFKKQKEDFQAAIVDYVKPMLNAEPIPRKTRRDRRRKNKVMMPNSIADN